MSHANARLTPTGRLLMVQRIEAGTPQAHVAEQMGLSRATVAKWWKRWVAEGRAGSVAAAHRRRARGPGVRFAPQNSAGAGAPGGPHRGAGVDGVEDPGAQRADAPLVDRPAHRQGHTPLRAPPPRRPSPPRRQKSRQDPARRRVEGLWQRPRAAPRGSKKRPRVGYSYLHVAIDDHSRLAYVEALDNETADTLVGFFDRARLWFRSIAVDEIITDNGPNFRSKKFADQLASHAIYHIFTRPYRPQTNGKAERFNRTLTDEFLYNHKFRSEPDRRRRLDRWTHDYNLHRHHTAIDGTPASRVHNLYGHYN